MTQQEYDTAAHYLTNVYATLVNKRRQLVEMQDNERPNDGRISGKISGVGLAMEVVRVELLDLKENFGNVYKLKE
jgi:hypothetical protein